MYVACNDHINQVIIKHVMGPYIDAGMGVKTHPGTILNYISWPRRMCYVVIETASHCYNGLHQKTITVCNTYIT